MNSLLDIAMQGRSGDTEFRVVKNELAHVNPMEAQLIDQHGGLGEQVVSEIGSGTINPYTGLREYYEPKYGVATDAWQASTEYGDWSWDWNWDTGSGYYGFWKSDEAIEEENRVKAMKESFDKGIGDFKGLNFATMTADQRRAAVTELMGENTTSWEMDKYFSKYDPTKELEAHKATTGEMRDVGQQTNVSLLDLMTQQKGQRAKSGFASTGNPMVDRQRQDIFAASGDAIGRQWDSFLNQRRDLQNEYNLNMIENAFQFEEAQTS